LDTAQDSVFMSDRKFKDFIENLEKVTHTDTQTEAPAEASTDANLEIAPSASSSPGTMADDNALLDEWWEEEAAEKVMEKPDLSTSAAGSDTTTASPAAARDLLSQGVSFLSRLGQTLSDEKATQTLVNELVQKDETSGETYLKIPVESAAVVQNAVKLLGSLFGKM